MKKLLLALFVGLLMSGCGSEKSGEDSPKSNEPSTETPTAKSPEVGGIDLDDIETRNRIIAEAIMVPSLPFLKMPTWPMLSSEQSRGIWSEKLHYAPDQQTPYTGWMKFMHVNGQIAALWQFKDGKKDGPSTWWHSNGQKRYEGKWKDGKQNGLVTRWWEDGQIEKLIQFKDGKVDGLMREWYPNGQKRSEDTCKNGKLVTSVAWKLKGEKCPVTNVVDGNGVRVSYWENGTEMNRFTHKDGEPVED